MAKIVVVGSVNMDLIARTSRLPTAGETILGKAFLTEPGGKGANQAVAAARLGGEVSILGRVGTDDYGKHMRASLEAEGCNVSGLRAVEGPSGVAVILVTDSGQNTIVVIPGANDLYLPTDLDMDARHFADAQIAMLQLETPMETVLAAAQTAKRQGATVILDPAPAPRALPSDFYSYVDILTPNETEAAQLVHRTPGAFSPDEARHVARELQDLGVRVVIIKLGARGCLLAEGSDVTLIPSPQVPAVDTTGAGDVFNGALSVACSEGASLVEACKAAVKAAALSVTRLGAQRGMPNRLEINAYFGSSTNRNAS